MVVFSGRPPGGWSSPPMKHRRPSALENATTQLGSRPLAFKTRLRLRTVKPSRHESGESKNSTPASEQTQKPSPRAILARAQQRARALGPGPKGSNRASARVAAWNANPEAAPSRGPGPTQPAEPQALSGLDPEAAEKAATHHPHFKACPRCGKSCGLTHRQRLDRIVSFVVPSHRWLCGSCGWSGLRADRHELKHLKRRVGRLIIILLAALLAFVVMWYVDYLKYSYHPPVEDMGPESHP